MASKTKKTSKKAGARKSSKTAAKKGSKKAASKSSKEAASKSSKKAAKKGGSGGEIGHTPIIVTDGSASIEFDDIEYPQVSTTTHTSAGLRCTRIRSDGPHSNGSNICHVLGANQRVLIVVTCRLGGSDPRTITLTGGNFMDGSGSPSIQFDHGIFNDSFTPIDPGTRRRVGKKTRKITRLEIFRVTNSGNTLVHDCDAIAQEGFIIRVHDPHLE